MTFRMDPRAKLYLLLLANLLLLFHVGTAAEAATTALCLLLFFLSGKIGMGLRLWISSSCPGQGRACFSTCCRWFRSACG